MWPPLVGRCCLSQKIRIFLVDFFAVKFIFSLYSNKNYISCAIKLDSGECIGINVDNGELMDAAEAQIYDHILIKDWQVRLGKKFLLRIIKNIRLIFITGNQRI